VHGSEEESTEVPRSTLVDALKSHSDFMTTESLAGTELSQTIEIAI
jgi:hypothetical protein